jgi:hypothetical protein
VLRRLEVLIQGGGDGDLRFYIAFPLIALLSSVFEISFCVLDILGKMNRIGWRYICFDFLFFC